MDVTYLLEINIGSHFEIAARLIITVDWGIKAVNWGWTTTTTTTKEQKQQQLQQFQLFGEMKE